MTHSPDTHTRARQHILAALDEVMAQIIFQADRLERLDVTVPLSTACELAQRVTMITVALVCYRAGAYQASVRLANIGNPGQETDYADWPSVV